MSPAFSSLYFIYNSLHYYDGLNWIFNVKAIPLRGIVLVQGNLKNHVEIPVQSELLAFKSLATVLNLW